MVQVLRWRFLDSGLPSPGTVYSQAFSGQCISVKYPRRTAGRGLDNLGVRMRFLLPPPPLAYSMVRKITGFYTATTLL